MRGTEAPARPKSVTRKRLPNNHHSMLEEARRLPTLRHLRLSGVEDQFG